MPPAYNRRPISPGLPDLQRKVEENTRQERTSPSALQADVLLKLFVL
jgi:hypothetical protein